ncbi:MAG: phosphate acyltransferase PlsX, partial [Sphingomonadales bacterium]
SQALRRGQESSMALAIRAVKEGESEVAVSAGNTGALMALAKFTLRTMPGIYRPALVGRFPTARGESVMLDMGANVECDEKSLVQFAVMGAAFARAVLGIKRPRIGLLNVGVEELKGNDAVKGAGQRLKETHLPLDFAGFIEGGDIATGMVDVVVTDGFTGNIAIKTAEGTALYMSALLKQAFRNSLMAKLGYVLARKELSAVREHFNPNNHNGGVFLGLNGLVVKSHGGTGGPGFASAIRIAAEMATDDLCGMIRENLDNMADEAETLSQAAAS